jgi:hypothetical protein
MAEKIAKYLSASATQGGADAFVETAITTNLVPSDGYAFKLTKMFWDATGYEGLGNNMTTEFGLSRDTKAAVARYSDADCMYYNGYIIEEITSGALQRPLSGEVDFPDGIYVVEPTIYLDLDSTGTSATKTLHVRLYYEEVKLSEVEILRLLNNA